MMKLQQKYKVHRPVEPTQWLCKDFNFGLRLLNRELHTYSGDGKIQSLCSNSAIAEDFRCFIIL